MYLITNSASQLPVSQEESFSLQPFAWSLDIKQSFWHRYLKFPRIPKPRWSPSMFSRNATLY